jgi:hypothetical protein
VQAPGGEGSALVAPGAVDVAGEPGELAVRCLEGEKAPQDRAVPVVIRGVCAVAAASGPAGPGSGETGRGSEERVLIVGQCPPAGRGSADCYGGKGGMSAWPRRSSSWRTPWSPGMT